MPLKTAFNAINNFVKYPSVKKCHDIAMNPNSTARDLATLEDHPQAAIVIAIADHENVSVDTLMNLSRHNNPLVRATVAEKIYTPVQALEPLAEDTCPAVRNTAAKTLEQIRLAQANISPDTPAL